MMARSPVHWRCKNPLPKPNALLAVALGVIAEVSKVSPYSNCSGTGFELAQARITESLNGA